MPTWLVYIILVCLVGLVIWIDYVVSSKIETYDVCGRCGAQINTKYIYEQDCACCQGLTDDEALDRRLRADNY